MFCFLSAYEFIIFTTLYFETTFIVVTAKKKLLVLVDDHPRVREALQHVLAEFHDSVTLYTADDPRELLPLAEKRLSEATDLTIVEIGPFADPPSGSAIPPDLASPVQPAESSAPDPGIAPLMVVSLQERGITAHWFAAIDPPETQEDDSHLQAVLDQREAVRELISNLRRATTASGAGYDLSDTESLMRLGLTQRQAEVLHSLAQGMSNKEIARQLQVSEWTVRHHVSAILERLDVTTRGRAALLARRLDNT